MTCSVQPSTEGRGGTLRRGSGHGRAHLRRVTDSSRHASATIRLKKRFGILLATTQYVSSATDGRNAGRAVVNHLADVASVRYAVLEALRTEGGSERFVVAYRNEYSLRDLIAAPCIAAFGFSSREEAVARTKSCVSMATIKKQVPRTTVVKRIDEHQPGPHRPEQRSETGSASQTIRRFLVAFYSDTVAAAILIFSSRNIISVAIRAFLAV